MDPVTVLKSGTEALGLISTLTQLIRESRRNAATQPTLRELLGRLQIEAVALSRDFENRVSTLALNLQEYGINPAYSIEQQLSSLAWFNWLARSRLKTFREDCHSIYRQLTAFIDDASAVLICEGTTDASTDAFKLGYEAKRELDAMFLDGSVTVGRLIDGMLATARRLSAELQAA